VADERDTMNTAEIPYDTGAVQFRYERRLAPDGTRWIRNGLFQAYHRNGLLATEGMYENGAETGLWRDHHESGQLAAEGSYRHGRKVGLWRYWDVDGKPEQTEDHG
jgi:antitoxin component YwqK of YwqJK toxin-antitoxin module